MGLVRRLVLGALRALPGREARRRRLAASTAAASPVGAAPARFAARVLILGVYLADRENSAAHLAERFAASPGLAVEQRWMALGGRAAEGPLGAVTVQVATGPAPKFTLLNRLLRPGDLDGFDFIVVCD